MSLGQLTVASIAFSQVQLSLSFQIERADSFAGLFASLDRVGGGKQQRVSFARLLLQRPQLVVLDEATSALDLESEAHLYGLVCGGSTTVISVGHRPFARDRRQSSQWRVSASRRRVVRPGPWLRAIESGGRIDRPDEDPLASSEAATG